MPAGHERYEDGFERVLLRVGDEPVDGVPRFIILLDEHIVRAENDLFFRLFGEEIRKVRAERFEDVGKRGDGGGGQVALELGNKTLGKLRARGKLLLRQAELNAPALDSVADVDQRKSLPKSINKLLVYNS